MWIVERPVRSMNHNSAVATLRDGVYWAVVTMTTVGYGDKTPKTAGGRVIAILWMLVSVALISILSTSIVSKMTAERVVSVFASRTQISSASGSARSPIRLAPNISMSGIFATRRSMTSPPL